VQFTPDLLPADITGTDVLHETTSGGNGRRVRFCPVPSSTTSSWPTRSTARRRRRRPRCCRRCRSGASRWGCTTHALPDPFQVFATRNPIEQEGTYPLPEAQLDRFLLEVHVEYPSAIEEREIARRTTGVRSRAPSRACSARRGARAAGARPAHPGHRRGRRARRRPRSGDAPARSRAPRAEVRELVRFGAGPRGSQALVLAAKARAALHGEAAADVDDVRALVTPVLRHRLVLSYRAEAEGVRDVDVLERVVAAVG
jgi:MoxR-like ATPase